MKKIISLALLFFTLNLFGQSAQLKGTNAYAGQNFFANMVNVTNGGIIYSFDGQGRFTMTNTINGAYSIQGTNGHYKSVDQYGNLREWTTNRFTVQVSVGGVSKTLSFTNGTLSVDSANVSTNGGKINADTGTITSDGLGNLTVQQLTGNLYFGNVQGNVTGSLFGNATTATTASGGSGAFSGAFTGNGLGFTNLNGAAVAAASANLANTYYSDTNALNFARLAGISDLGTRSDLIGFVNELRKGNLWSNFVDCAILYPRFNPGAGYSFMGRPMSVTGPIGKWGLGCRSSSGQAIITGLPDMRTNSQVYVWHTIPTLVSGGNLPMAYLGGVCNTNVNQSLYFCAGESCTVLGFRIRANGVENANPANNVQASWLLNNSIFGFAYTRFGPDMFSGNKEVTGYNYNGSSLSGWHRYRQVEIDYNNPTLSTNYALAGLQISAPLTNWWIGKDYWTTNITTVASADVEIGLLLNAPLTNLNDWKTVYRALRWLDPDNKDFRLVGDSREDVTQGVGVPGQQGSVTNYAFAIIKQNQEANTNAINILNDSISGDAIGHYSPLAISDSAWTNWIGPFDSGFVPAGKVVVADTFLTEGINDVYGSFNTMLNSNIVAIAKMSRSNNISLHIATIFQTATNGSVYAQSANELYRTNANYFIHSNATMFASIVLWDEYINQTMCNTNNGITYDGTHQLGSNSPPILAEEANLLMGDPLPSGSISNQTLNYVGKFTGSGSLTNLAQNTITYTNFLFGSFFTNTSTRNELVVGNARCNPTTTGNALFALVTSPTGATYTTSSIAGLEADIIFTTAPHSWYQLTAQVPPGGIWQFLDKTGEGFVTMTNSYYQTLQ